MFHSSEVWYLMIGVCNTKTELNVFLIKPLRYSTFYIVGLLSCYGNLHVACAGAEGKVDESLAVLAEVETLKTKKKEAEVM